MEQIVDSNSKKLIIKFAIFIVLFISTVYSFIVVFFANKINTIEYKENSQSIYTVKLKQNDYYETDRLPQGMNYIASLIDEIDIAYNYLFSSSEEINYSIDYSIDAITRVYSPDEKSILFEKKETLLDVTKDSKDNIRDYNFAKDVIVDYQHFNDLAKQFKASYSLNTNSDLSIQLNVKSQGTNSNYKGSIDLDSKCIIVVPLTERTVNISINNDNITNEGSISGSKIKSVSIIHVIILIASVIGLIIVVYDIIKYLIGKMKSRTKYDIELSRILKENDSIIANVNNGFNPSNYEIISVSSFEELRDIHDNINLPILFNETIKGNEASFSICDDKVLYLYTLKGFEK